MKELSLVAIDIGAGSGRFFLTGFDGKKIFPKEVYRFENEQILLGNTLYWDFLNIFKNVGLGLCAAYKNNNYKKISSVGIDTWGADFGILDNYGDLIENPVSYRDKRTEGISKYIYEEIPGYDLFNLNSTKTYNYCALFQLLYLYKFKKENAKIISSYLPIPNLINYFLTGEKVSEPSVLTATQFFDVDKKVYLTAILDKFSIPKSILPLISEAGKVIGILKKQVSSDLGLPDNIKVSLVCGHDSASAVNGIPIPSGYNKNYNNCCYLLSGTWAVVGIETKKPLVGVDVYNSDFTNWVSYKDNIIFLKIFNCFYFIQEYKKLLERKAGKSIDYEMLLSNLYDEDIKINSLINLSSQMLFKSKDNLSGNLIENISEYFKLTNQKLENLEKEIVKIIFVSIILETKLAVENLEKFSGKKFKSIYITGGGSQNIIFCQWLSDCLGIEVIAVCPESTINGNLIIQLLAVREINNLDEGREIIGNSFNNIEYHPVKSPKINWINLEVNYINLKRFEEAK